MARIGDIVTVDELGAAPHAIIGQSSGGGYWLQNLVTGALPVAHRPYISGFMPKEMTVQGRAIDRAGLSCQIAGNNHSEDVITHYNGSTTPELVCGYHLTANTEWRNN
jgi:hypothetical protein